MPSYRSKIREQLSLILIDFLHDVKAVNWTAGNEIDMDEKNYSNLVNLYAIKLEKLHKLNKRPETPEMPGYTHP